MTTTVGRRHRARGVVPGMRACARLRSNACEPGEGGQEQPRMLDLALPWPPRWTASGASGWRPRGDGLGVKEGENRSSPRGAAGEVGEAGDGPERRGDGVDDDDLGAFPMSVFGEDDDDLGRPCSGSVSERRGGGGGAPDGTILGSIGRTQRRA